MTAAHVAVFRVLERHPGLRVLLAHGGGTLPAVRGRLRQGLRRPRRGQGAQPRRAGRVAAPGSPATRLTHVPVCSRDLIRYAGADLCCWARTARFLAGAVRRLRSRRGPDLRRPGGQAARVSAAAAGRPDLRPLFRPGQCVCVCVCVVYLCVFGVVVCVCALRVFRRTTNRDGFARSGGWHRLGPDNDAARAERAARLRRGIFMTPPRYMARVGRAGCPWCRRGSVTLRRPSADPGRRPPPRAAAGARDVG